MHKNIRVNYLKITLSTIFLTIFFNCYSQNLIDSNGKKQGKWITYKKFKRQTLQVIDNYLNDTLNGDHIIYNEKGDTISFCNFYKGIAVGKVFLKDVEGRLLKDYFLDKEGLFHGTFIQYWTKSNKLLFHKLHYNHGIREGKQYIYNSEGKVMIECTMKNGFIDDSLKTYHNNGNIRSISLFQNGKIASPMFAYNEKGVLVLVKYPHLGSDIHYGSKEVYRKAKLIRTIKILEVPFIVSDLYFELNILDFER